MKRLLLYIIGISLIIGCSGDSTKTDDKELIYVSILPLKGVVEQIVGPNIAIEVLVPAGASPESFEPTARQLVELAEARLVMGVGLLDFEKSILKRLSEEREITNLAHGIKPIAGSCSHHHSHHTPHTHGIDPHVWCSPKELKIIAENAYNALRELYPDSVQYAENHARLIDKINMCDSLTSTRLKAHGIKSFYIYHPAMTYYARAYGIEQVAIEHEGKEPSVRRVGELIDRGRNEGIRNIFYQSQFPASSVEVIARDLEGKAISINPLAEDIISEIERFTTLLCED